MPATARQDALNMAVLPASPLPPLGPNRLRGPFGPSSHSWVEGGQDEKETAGRDRARTRARDGRVRRGGGGEGVEGGGSAEISQGRKKEREKKSGRQLNRGPHRWPILEKKV